MSRYDRETTTDQVLEGVDLSGQRIVITGASSGLGEESARALASKGASITMVARDRDKNEAAAARIREGVPSADLELRDLELGNLAGIRAFAKDFLADHDRIDTLINNAGVMACPQATTDDGFELQLGTNHLGHFLLTLLLVPALARSERPRVVALSSGAHGISDVDYDDPMFERRAYDPWVAYGQSKTANALFAVELDGRLKGHGGAAYSVHPGMIMTSLGRHLTPELMAGMQQRIVDRAKADGKPPPSDPGMLFKPVEAGAATQVWAATAPELAEHGGAYLADCQLGEPGGNVGEHGVEPHATDRESATRLWTLSEAWVGEHLSS
jgi:NAD(P)-dependent dehydrogenase (short-subunit alcohol dehydrogenase family)